MNINDIDGIDMDLIKEAFESAIPEQHLTLVISELIAHNWWPKKEIQDWTEDDLTIIRLLIQIESYTDEELIIFNNSVEKKMQKAIDSNVEIKPRTPHNTDWDDLIEQLQQLLNNKNGNSNGDGRITE